MYDKNLHEKSGKSGTFSSRICASLVHFSTPLHRPDSTISCPGGMFTHMPKLKVINFTQYHTWDLRRFFLAGMTHRGTGPKTVTVQYSRYYGDIGGSAYMPQKGEPEETDITMLLPGRKYLTGKDTNNPLDLLELAQVFEHELDHTMGLDHRDMQEWWDLKPTWHEGLKIRWVPKLKRAPEKLLQERRAQVEAKVTEWSKKARYARQKLAKWRKKLRYYKRRARRLHIE